MSRLALVTGGAGFIGSVIVDRLIRDGWDVAVCDWLGEAELGKWRNLAKHPIADFVPPETMFDWLAAHRSQLGAVVHMGAISSTTEPDADLIVTTNLVLSRRLWDWCCEAGVRMIYASSAATYGDGDQGFDDADDLASLSALRPLNAYGWSKAAFDIVARRSADAGRAPPQWAGLKFFNVYGPNEYHKGAMRSVVHQLYPRVARGEEVTLFRSHRPGVEHGGQQRDFVYVKDCADVAAWLAQAPTVSGVFNLGTGQARSFRDLAQAVFDALGREPRIVYIDTPEAIREKYQYFTQARMQRLRDSGYAAPFTSLEAGVGDYIAGYLSRPDPYL
jgi:ADP-L-glycero-D-manno-heptose 6-epimerase